MSVLTQPKRQIAAKIESTEGTAETLTNAEANHLVLDSDLSFSAEIGMHDRDIVQASFSRHKALAGVEAAKIGCSVELRGSGALNTAPSWDSLLKACGFGRSVAVKIAVGAISGGPFVHGETVTGGTSTATGRVVGTYENGATAIYVVVTSGTFQAAETLTGGTSAATATSGTVTAAGGFVYEPTSDSIPSLSLAMMHDGTKKLVKGARGNVRLAGKVGEPGRLVFEYEGVYGGVTDVALLTGITYESTIPPVLKGTTLSFDSFSPVVTEFGIDMGNVVALRESMAATAGAISARITGRAPKGTFNPEMDLVANFDFFGRMKGETLHRTEFVVGSTEGNRFRIVVPQTQIESVGMSDRSGISAVDLGVRLIGGTSYQDREVSILCY